MDETKKQVIVAVHDGVFHADDVFAVAILKHVFPNLKIIRTRNEKKLAQATIRADVGQKYDPATGDFDHHQQEGAGQRDNGIMYAACGLVWKHFGETLVGSQRAARTIDKRLIQTIDAADNGQEICAKTIASPYTLYEMVHSLNPSWNEEKQNFNAAFKKAVDIAHEIIKREIIRVKGKQAAKEKVREAIAQAKDHPDYIILDAFYPWEKIVLTESSASYVLFPTPTNEWHIRCVPTQPGSFDIKTPFPEEWAGKEKKEFAKLTGIKDAQFCHRARFIAGTKTKQAAIELVHKALNY